MMINIREKLKQHGTQALTTQELIAVILGTGTRDYDVTKLSANVLISSDNLRKLSLDSLVQQKVVGHAQACKLLAAVELGARKIQRDVLPKEQISLSKMGEHLIKKIGNSSQEKLVAVYLDNGFHVIDEKVIFIGTVDSATVHPRDVLCEALKLSAPQVIICHNHPGGSLIASPEDRRFTQRLIDCCHLVGVNLVDHLIVTPRDYLSFKAQDLI